MANNSLNELHRTLPALDQAQSFVQLYSPFLSHLYTRHPEIIEKLNTSDADAAWQQMQAEWSEFEDSLHSREALSKALREAKAQTSLLVALADITGAWELEKVTQALSEFAGVALQACVRHLLNAAVARGEIAPLPYPETPEVDSGLIILGMGKLGGGELNYSSDIDLIVFFEPSYIEYKGRQNIQHFFSRLAQDIVTLMQERTRDGYVFRTDLRLRPDPASTPPAVSVNAALYYYESVGQNWERAALIKAKPVAGDLKAGQDFLKELTPFLWRKHLDFAAIQDIQSIKRQMDGVKDKTIHLPGHNVKIGFGGIREIEFYTQIHQLIWGGRRPELRIRPTCKTLALLLEDQLISNESYTALVDAYPFLRMVEHRLQMIDDQQTHSLPEEPEKLDALAAFCGFENYEAFADVLMGHLQRVHKIFSSSFRSERTLGDEGSLVFTGVSHDPETLKTLQSMGFEHVEMISETIMAWHRGNRRCTRTKRAREMITELMPTILRALAATPNPDIAFNKFDVFLQNIPAGVQLFSLFSQNPHLLDLIADIMGSAPVLAETLSRYPELLDMVLYGNFYQNLPDKDSMAHELQELLSNVDDLETRQDFLRRFKKEKQFQAGVQLLKKLITGEQNGVFLSKLAEVCLEQALRDIRADFATTYGTIKGAEFAILALGKLGSCELAFDSDIDLVLIYDVPDFDALSDGEKQFTASVYFNRLAPRLLNALSSLSREGLLYEVDTRLRPSGKQGLLAVSLKAFHHYFGELAWTFERMALVRGRAVAGDAGLMEKLEVEIQQQLCRKIEASSLMADVHEMRRRIGQEYPPNDGWDVKHARGGLMDVDFIAQSLALAHAHKHPDLLMRATGRILDKLAEKKLYDEKAAKELCAANRFFLQLQQIMRLTCGTHMQEDRIMLGMKKLLAANLEVEDFDALNERLHQHQEIVYRHYKLALGEY